MSSQRELPQAVIEALMRGDKIGAIKLVREASGGDLRTAMQQVQQLAQQYTTQARQPQTPNQRVQQGQPRGGSEITHTDARMRADVAMSRTRTPTVMPGDRGASGLGRLLMIGGLLLAWWWLSGQTS